MNPYYLLSKLLNKFIWISHGQSSVWLTESKDQSFIYIKFKWFNLNIEIKRCRLALVHTKVSTYEWTDSFY